MNPILKGHSHCIPPDLILLSLPTHLVYKPYIYIIYTLKHLKKVAMVTIKVYKSDIKNPGFIKRLQICTLYFKFSTYQTKYLYEISRQNVHSYTMEARSILLHRVVLIPKALKTIFCIF